MNMFMTLNLPAKFERNRWFEYFHLLPGPLVDTLLIFKTWRLAMTDYSNPSKVIRLFLSLGKSISFSLDFPLIPYKNLNH